MFENKWVYIIILFGWVIIAGTVAEIVLSIIALKNTTNNDVIKECPNSALWPYVFVSLIYDCFILITANVNANANANANVNANANANANVNANAKSANVFGGFVSWAIFTWGCIEIWGVDCVDRLSDTLLYKMGLFYVFSIIVWIIVIVVGTVGWVACVITSETIRQFHVQEPITITNRNIICGNNSVTEIPSV